MATVRKPSSFAARKMRMAISLRLAASSLRIGFSFFIAGRRDITKLYIFAQNLDQAGTVFSMHRMQSLYGQIPVSVVGAQHAYTSIGTGSLLCGLAGSRARDSGRRRTPNYGRGAVAGGRATPELAVSGFTGAVFNCRSSACTFAQALALRFVA